MPASADLPTVVVAMHLPRAFMAALAEGYEVVGPLSEPLETRVQALPAAVAARVRALVTMGTVGASDATMARLPQLGVIACTGSGYERVDLAAAAARGIVVTHSPAANADSVADVALGLLIASVRRFSQGRALLESGGWQGNAARSMPLSRGLRGLRVGIYGLGAIGERVAQRVIACGAVVGYHGRSRHPDAPHAYFPTLPGLAEWADALVVTVRAEAGNRHAVDEAVLRALGPDGHVVNISRGSVIDEAALVEALDEGSLAGAGLDVYEHEPDVPASLLRSPRAVLTPHLGGGTLEAQAAMQAMVLRNLAAFFAGEPVPTPVPGSLARPST